jgi:hypothetical protein
MAAPIVSSARIALPATINVALSEFGVPMQRTSKWIGAGLLFVAGTAPLFATTTEVLRNEKVIVTEVTLAPGDQEPVGGVHASVLVVLEGDSIQMLPPRGYDQAERSTVHRGDTINQRAGAEILTNAGTAPLRLVRVEFRTSGSDETWGMTGLPPNDNVLFEDEHSRTYEIRIAAHAVEPEHTHHARVVVCLSGAQLEHVLPDGSKQAATLKTDEVTWREAQTHTGRGRNSR